MNFKGVFTLTEGQKAEIDITLCTGCGICIDICPYQALEIIDGLAKLTKPEVCDGLGNCVDACPMQAITLK